MPHFDRVANLFRSSTEHHNLAAVKASFFSHTSNSLDRVPSPAVPDENDDSDDNTEHHETDEDNTAASRPPSPPTGSRLVSLTKMQQTVDNTRRKHLRRHFTFPWPGRESPDPAALDCLLESQPVVFYGSPDDSSGAPVSGQLVLEVFDEQLEVINLEVSIVVRVVQRRPFQGHCKECEVREEELKDWKFLHRQLTLPKGMDLSLNM